MEEILKEIIGSSARINGISSISGGDINEVFKITTDRGAFCLKKNLSASFPGMFTKEAHGLELLRNNSSFRIPEVIGLANDETYQYLLLEFIASGNQRSDFWEIFGINLAELHRVPSKYFGLTESNYIGSLVQSNKRHETWSEFYTEERILPQTRMAFEKGLIPKTLVQALETLCSKFHHLLPQETPSLLHGDLWSGNFMVDPHGNPVLIDPAVYSGHREMDLGMMHLFGGFESTLFDSYNSAFPLEKGWKERLPLSQLYPLLVHVNLFGSSYVPDVQSIALRFS